MRANDRSERAWAKAAQLAEGVEDRGVGRAVRRYFTRYWPALALASFGVGFFGIRLLDDGSAGPLLNLQAGFLLVALASMIGGYAYWWRRIRPLVQPQRMPITAWLDKPDEKWVVDQILGRMPVMPEHLPVLRGTAAQLRASGSLNLALAPSYLFMAASFAVSWRGPVLVSLWALVMLLSVYAVASTVRTLQRAGRFLKATTAAGTGGEAPPAGHLMDSGSSGVRLRTLVSTRKHR
ncbi:hypothetical protein [Arthrobacter sp. JSM 101049]|uniref:hypothetical protein n=1 Tax=Arthrobacter sp. JSM 101049 TaxID=929097 RepID=UPI0035614C4E